MYKIIITMFFAIAISAMPLGMTASAHEGHGGGGGHMGGHEGGHGGGWHEGHEGWHGGHEGWHGHGHGWHGGWHNPCWEDGEWVCD